MLPISQDPRWTKLIDNPERYEYSTLALKIMMQRIATRARTSPLNPLEKRAALTEVQSFFTKYERMLQADIKAIFG